MRLVRFIAASVLTGVLTASSSAQPSLLGPEFSAFVDSVLAAPEGQRSALVDSFLVDARPTPFVESDTVAYFLFRGQASSVGVPGDMNGWDGDAWRMTLLEGTDLWYREAVFEPTARLDYKLVVSGSQWILDPWNPLTVVGGFGANSELAMPAYVQPVEIERYSEIDHGGIVDHGDFPSTHLGDTRTIRVYLPAGYDTSGERRYGVMLFHDGLEYFSLGRGRNVLDYLIFHDRIEPIIGVFVPPRNRNEEYGFGSQDAYEAFIVEEVMPFIDATYRTSTDPAHRGTLGASLGGLISAQLCYRNPDQFGLCAPVSPSFQVNGGALAAEIGAGERKDVKFYVDWGIYEPTIQVVAGAFVNMLETKGYEYRANDWFEGHSWGNWRAHLSNALEYFFPFRTGSAVDDDIVQPQAFEVINFPNPFVTTTRIPVSLERPGFVRLVAYDILGRVVAIISHQYTAGEHQILLNGDHLPGGSYVFHLHTDGKEFRGLMTIVR